MIFCPRSAWRGTHYDGQQHQAIPALCVKKDFDNKFPELVAPIRRILGELLREAVLETSESDDDVKNRKRPRDDESFDALESDDESPLDLLNAQQES
eukprot:4502244-Pleurochrysis_carterae.AAC.1